MSEIDFSKPSRQSSKGILVILGVNIYKVLKGVFIVLTVFFLKYIKSDKGLSLNQPSIYLPSLFFLVYFIVNAFLKFKNFKFHTTKTHFILNHGIINKEETSIAKNKIQNVYIKQNLIQQIINVVSLSIETAGDDITEIEIQALTKEKAQSLKAELLESKINIENKTETKQSKINTYYQATFKKLLLEGISENHLRSLIFIFAFFVGIYNDFKEFLKSFNIKTRFDAYLQLDDKAIISLIVFNLILVFALLVIAFLYSLIKIFIVNFELKVTEKDNGLEISKGLFNKINLGLVPSRIQNTTIKTNRFKQALGLHKLAFSQAMVNKKQQKNFAIIGLNKKQVNHLVDKFYNGILNNLVKNKPEFYFILRSAFPFVLLLFAFNIVFYLVNNQLFWFNIPLVFLMVFSVIYGYKKAYYSIDDKYVIIGSGRLIDTNTDFLELHKIQAVNLQQTIFEKRRKLASVVIYSATKALTIPNIKESQAKKITNYLLFKIESTSKSWM